MAPLKLEFTFVVGQTEMHDVRFVYQQFWGRLKISVDGAWVIRDWPDLPPFGYQKDYRFTVGQLEQHEVVIRKIKPAVPLAGLLPHTILLIIDGKQIGEYHTH